MLKMSSQMQHLIEELSRHLLCEEGLHGGWHAFPRAW
jgi:hypothetical protein